MGVSRTKKLIFPVALTALAACLPLQPAAEVVADTCGASRCASSARDQVTLDHLPERPDFLLDYNGAVTNIACG
ncbi:MAG: hypothetical protein LJE68_01965 [Rhodobacter sp.]|nr:hypothetical protein [Rhodobacter sp.]